MKSFQVRLRFTPLLLLLSFFSLTAQPIFQDDFENGLSGWEINANAGVKIIDSGDGSHAKVMALIPDGNVFALIKNSEKWGPLRLEGEMLFPKNEHNYLGFIFNYQKNSEREDFGVLYVKGNGSYIRANPWRDGNVSRLLYEEYRTNLRGDQAIIIGQWHKFKMEVVGHDCHLYIGNMETPKVTFDLFERSSGKVGFQPRVVGGNVWVDNIKVTAIKALSYQGPKIPNIEYQSDKLITKWEVLGPFSEPSTEVERSFEQVAKKIKVGRKNHSWQPFLTDRRGAVVTGKVTQYEGPKTVAYFRTTIEASEAKTVTIHFTTTDELTLFLNGTDWGRIYRDGYISPKNDWNAWYDFWKNPKHAGRKVPIDLEPGLNQILIKVRNGQFASGGFFAYLEE